MNPKKLILLDIFSYSCMNCLRSLKYIKQLDNKYKKYGLKTIIMHVPEWKFERNANNVNIAINKLKIRFSKIIDKNKKLIKKLKIDFWPSQVLLKDKRIIYKHIGEGSYKKLESKIIKALNVKTKPIFIQEPSYKKYPTVYCGKKKNGKIEELNNKTKNREIRFGIIYKQGNWIQNNECLKHHGNNGIIRILKKGDIVNFVASSLSKKPIKAIIEMNNKPVKVIKINEPRLYNILELKNKTNEKILEIGTNGKLAIYSFSFE